VQNVQRDGVHQRLHDHTEHRVGSSGRIRVVSGGVHCARVVLQDAHGTAVAVAGAVGIVAGRVGGGAEGQGRSARRGLDAVVALDNRVLEAEGGGNMIKMLGQFTGGSAQETFIS